ncbi:hypothetical protein [Krasilnikovia sp. MM14-A1259]|uniref:hypothetical protein n=1 Tax=Krasilnikovia sp. MM14-A1259 TaxID=3373539 RepID=UPI00399C8B4E
MVDGNGTPMKVLTTGANVPDISKAVDLLDAVPPVAGRLDRPRPPIRGAAGRQIDSDGLRWPHPDGLNGPHRVSFG